MRRIRENRKGFTLVEMVVVMVIIAILATLMIGALNGYIDKAKEKMALSYCRSVVVAAQTQLSEAYAAGQTPTTLDGPNNTYFTTAKVRELAAIPDDVYIEAVEARDGKVEFVCVRLSEDSDFLYTYEDGVFTKGERFSFEGN
ncbi:MAG: prepilin-type N-terminal cleavage/methylation domain-containing protein [Lachnospiraceae bacterium]|nr:prepilin-type N-terminal cleavage/methylation domain-containing protein [Lachnospiraceae bacterium]